MTRESLYTIRKYLTRARVSGHEEEEFFWALKQLDAMIAVSHQIPRDTQRVA
jgi:hypothetical protein